MPKGQLIRLNYRHGVKIIDTVMELYREKRDPYNRPGAKLPQHPDHMPTTLVHGSPAHAQFLFAACYYMRGGVDSNTAFKRLSMVFDQSPHYFDPFCVGTQVSEDELSDVLEAVGLNYRKKVNPVYWIENARLLVERWDGNPANIFAGVSDYEAACARIKNDFSGGGFKGFQKKMVSMLTYFLMNDGFIDPFDFPIPVDIHVARLSLQTRIVTVPGAPKRANLVYDERVNDRLRDFYLRYSVEERVDPLDLCNAVWLYSRTKCADSPFTKTRTTKRNKNRKATVRPIKPDWSRPATMRRWLSCCGSCPISGDCHYSIPAAYYYVHGQIRLDTPRRLPPPESSILSLEESSATYAWRPPKMILPPVAPPEPNPDQVAIPGLS